MSSVSHCTQPPSTSRIELRGGGRGAEQARPVVGGDTGEADHLVNAGGGQLRGGNQLVDLGRADEAHQGVAVGVERQLGQDSLQLLREDAEEDQIGRIEDHLVIGGFGDGYLRGPELGQEGLGLGRGPLADVEVAERDRL